MLATQFYPIGARQVFPCFDDPSFKATFNISIKHFAHYMALSNMPVRNTNRASLTMEWTHFQRTPVMSTYLLVIMLSDFPRTSVKEINFRYHRSQPELGTEFAQRVIQNISLHFKSEWLRFQKLPKVDHVVLPNFLRNGVEYWGLIFYRESDILYIEELYSVGRKVDIARLIAQKIAYQWYGNLVSPRWWSDAWLYEGLTTLLATDAINKTYPEFRIWDLFIVQIQQESLRLESIMKPVSSEVNTPSDINLVFSFEYYLKGPALLRMLRYTVNNEVFGRAVEKFLDSYSTNADEFWISSEDALETFFPERSDVSSRMDSWIYSSKHPPVLKMTKNNSKSVMISVEDNYLLHETKPWIPVTQVTLQHDFEIKKDPDVIWLNPSNDPTKSYTTYIIDNNFHWIILNVEQAGYYRVNYETDNWLNISNYLNDINNYTNIHVLNRAQLIDDAFYFLKRGQLKLSAFHKLVEYLQYETDYVAWFPMFKGLESISTYFLFSESNDFLGTIKNVLTKLLRKIGYIESFEDNLTKSLKQEAARWACTFNIMHCIYSANDMLKFYLQNLDSYTILPWWKKWAFCNGLTYTEFNEDAFWLMFYKWQDSNDDALIKYISCSRSSDAMYHYINLTNNASENCNSGNQCKDANMLAKKRVNRFLYIVAKNSKEDVIFDYIKENYDNIKPREVSTVATFIIMINHIYYSPKLDEVNY
ncbi:PREDICTED: aminopeptidase Ey-like, partial [Cyphomyrmex costatus]|uniref:aminopeptidase Ey-like n=1 Tax=Cyphomyrmex costatus TaxID=456900 RepID=UPI0008522281